MSSIIEIIDKKQLSNMLNSLSMKTKTKIILINKKGEIIYSSSNSNILKQCFNECIINNIPNLIHKTELSEYQCKSSINQLIYPIIIEKKLYGWIIAGNFTNTSIEDNNNSCKRELSTEELNSCIKFTTREEYELFRNMLSAFFDTIIQAVLNKKDISSESNRLKLLNQIMRAANNGLKIQESFTELIPSLINTLGLKACSIYLYSGQRFSSENIIEEKNVQIEDIVTKSIKRNGNFFFVSDIAKEFSFKDIKNISKISNSLLSMPLSHGLGILNLYYEKNNDKGKSQIEFLNEVAKQVGIIASNAKKFQNIHFDSVTDNLTNIFNKAYFLNYLTNEIKKKRQEKEPTSLILFDIDDFKNYNDHNGHVEGDNILKEVGKILKECIRIGDIAARYGGEEFVILLPSTKQDSAKIVAERIRKRIEKFQFPHMNSQPKNIISISVGIITCMNSSLNPKDMISLADKAMYTAKKEGKNKTKSLLCIDKSLDPIDVENANELYKS